MANSKKINVGSLGSDYHPRFYHANIYENMLVMKKKMKKDDSRKI